MVRRTRTVGNLVAFVSTLTLVLVTAGPGLGAPDGDGGGLLGILDLDTQTQIDDLFATEDPSILSSDPGVTKFGPFESDTTDSGTCGPDWAQDHVFRFFAVKVVSSVGGLNTYRVTEKFKNGTFRTTGPLSPRACDSSDGTPPGVLSPGITGAFHGYDLITVTSTLLNPNATCPYPCFSTDDFLLSAFGAAGPGRETTTLSPSTMSRTTHARSSSTSGRTPRVAAAAITAPIRPIDEGLVRADPKRSCAARVGRPCSAPGWPANPRPLATVSDSGH